MGKTYALYRRELAYYFQSPVAYAVIAVFVLLAGYFFYNLLGYFNLTSIQAMQNPLQARSLSLTTSVLQPLFGNMSAVLLLLLPLLTMRLFTEERRSGSAELLFTYPVTDWNVIMGKFLAAATVYGVMLAMTLPCPALLYYFSTPETGAVVSGYLGLFLMGITFLAMGMFFSSLGDSQLVAGAATFGCGLLFLIVGWVTPFVSPGVGAVLEQLSIVRHLDAFARGVIDTNDLVFYANITVFFLFLCARVLDSARWRS
ncbi:MAG TPA: ABC transporter permease [Candidatus Krumholzibacteria bacterium]|nr:ABC transporter permease [Candidatus Krumholzibacteria bacterium]